MRPSTIWHATLPAPPYPHAPNAVRARTWIPNSMKSPANVLQVPPTRNVDAISQPASRDSTPPPLSTGTGVLTVVLTLLGWSSVPLFISHFAKTLDLWTSNGWRYGFSALLWAPVVLLGWRRGTLPSGIARAAILPALFNSMGQVAFAWSFYKIDPTTATFGLRLQIVFVAVGAYLMFPSERVVLRHPASCMGILLVLGGIGGTIFLAPGATSKMGEHTFGVVLAISGGLLFACYGLAVRRTMHGFHPVTAFAVISQYTSIVMVALMVGLGRRSGLEAVDPAVLPVSQFGLLLVSAVIGIALGHVFYYISIARLGVAVSSGVIQLQPFCVALGQFALFGNQPTGGQILCGLIAVAGATLLLGVQWRLTRRAEMSRPAAAREAAES